IKQTKDEPYLGSS
ncbi:Carbon storage regulator, partial [Haemophilus influenzae]